IARRDGFWHPFRVQFKKATIFRGSLRDPRLMSGTASRCKTKDGIELRGAKRETGMSPFEHNLQRLLKDAYQPEVPDPAFVADLEQRLRSTAQERAAVQASERRVARVRRW